MNTSTRNGPDERPFGKRTVPVGLLYENARTAIACRLCRETILLETNFRPTAATCPHCGLKFVFDPQQEPLPVPGLRLRVSDVLEVQRRSSTRYKRHDAHVRPAVQVTRPRPTYLAWVGGAILSLAACAALFSGWFHRLLAH